MLLSLGRAALARAALVSTSQARCTVAVACTAWSETVAVVLASSLLLLAMTLPAFQSFFIAEDFIHPGLYYAHGQDFWRALLSPSDGIFFRPVVFANNLFWMSLLPLDPLAHHIRNFAYTVVNLVLLHRILAYLVASPVARGMALLFFALSKVHLTTIGYINVYDSIVMLMLLLLTVLCFLRYSTYHRITDYALGLLFCGLSIFTKDYGLVVTMVVAGLAAFADLTPGPWRARVRWWSPRLVPLAGLVVAYLAVRYSVVGFVPSGNPVYSPALSPDVAARKLLVFTSTLWNVSFTDPGLSGSGGVLSGLVTAWIGPQSWTRGIELPVYLLGMALLVGTAALGWRAGRVQLFPLAWIAAYFGPTFLTRNVQLYYGYEPLAGLAVLLGIWLDCASRHRTTDIARRLPRLWTIALVVLGINGAVSNYASRYSWQERGDAAHGVWQTALVPRRDTALESVTFLTGCQPVWQWTLTADGKGPMIPLLLGRPELLVQVLDTRMPVSGGVHADPAHLVIDLDDGDATYDRAGTPVPAADRPILSGATCLQ